MADKPKSSEIDDFIEWFLEDKEDKQKTNSREIVLMKKICMLGDPAVGKTSTIARFVYSVFDDKYLETIGAKVTKKVMTLTHVPTNQNFKLKLMLWDIAGKRTLESVRSSYYREAEGALIVCDITRKTSLLSLESWIKSFFDVAEEVPIVLIGNKADLKEQAEFKEEELAALARKYNCSYILTSAKTGQNVEEAFGTLGRRITQNYLEEKTRN